MCLLNYKLIKNLTNKEKLMKSQILDEIINNVLDNKIDRLRFRNKKFV